MRREGPTGRRGDWELELISHVLKRMVDRRVSDVDLRRMMETAMGLRRGR